MAKIKSAGDLCEWPDFGSTVDYEVQGKNLDKLFHNIDNLFDNFSRRLECMPFCIMKDQGMVSFYAAQFNSIQFIL